MADTRKMTVDDCHEFEEFLDYISAVVIDDCYYHRETGSKENKEKLQDVTSKFIDGQYDVSFDTLRTATENLARTWAQQQIADGRLKSGPDAILAMQEMYEETLLSRVQNVSAFLFLRDHHELLSAPAFGDIKEAILENTRTTVANVLVAAPEDNIRVFVNEVECYANENPDAGVYKEGSIIHPYKKTILQEIFHSEPLRDVKVKRDARSDISEDGAVSLIAIMECDDELDEGRPQLHETLHGIAAKFVDNASDVSFQKLCALVEAEARIDVQLKIEEAVKEVKNPETLLQNRYTELLYEEVAAVSGLLLMRDHADMFSHEARDIIQINCNESSFEKFAAKGASGYLSAYGAFIESITDGLYHIDPYQAGAVVQPNKGDILAGAFDRSNAKPLIMVIRE